MSVKKSIGWCTHTNNAITGCLGPRGVPCRYCWAVIFRKRLKGIDGTLQRALYLDAHDINTPVMSRYKLALLDTELGRARKPRRIFFASMGDLGYGGRYKMVEPRGTKLIVMGEAEAKWVQNEARQLFAKHPRHTFLILSKQPGGLLCSWPQNVHVGVSVSDSEPESKARTERLHAINCGVRWVSLEPLLVEHFDPGILHDLDWVALGVESGPRAKDEKNLKLTRTAWDIRLWCLDNKIPCYAKSNLRKLGRYPWPKEFPDE